MATIRREIPIEARPVQVWDAVRDIGNIHTRLAPGLVISTTLEENARLVTFANGLVLRERIVDIDDSDRRLAWSVVGAPFAHHNASLQVFEDGEYSRAVWIADFLPHELKDQITEIMEQGLRLMKQTLEGTK